MFWARSARPFGNKGSDAMIWLPLLRSPRPDDIFARRHGAAFSVARFLGDVASLAARLPDHGHVANLCHDRYRFAVGFAAALCRRQITLLPPSDMPAQLDEILAGYGDVYCLADTGHSVSVPVFTYPHDLARHSVTPGTPDFPPDQPAAILFTSGSSGVPQPHRRSWGLLVSSAVSAGDEMGMSRLPQAALIGTVPHQHSYGLESLVMLALQNGLVLHAERPFYASDIRDQLAAAGRPCVLVTTPFHLRVLLAEPDRLPLIDCVISATAPLPQDLALTAEAGLHAELHEIYGCSEVGQLATRRTVQTDEWHCLAGIALRQDGASTWAGGSAIATESRLADIVELRDSRHFRLLGRHSDVINIAGKRSSLAYLNIQLNAIDGVVDAAFVMADDAASGTARLAAFVVAPGLTPSDILAALRSRIDPAFLPRRLTMVDVLPRNTLGKLTRDSVAKMLSGAESA